MLCSSFTLDAFLSEKTDRVVYWGTSGERITDSYAFDSFGMAELVESSVLLYGKDVRKELKYPTFHELSPLERKDDKETFDYAESLAEPIQRFADVLEKELNVSK